MKNKLIIVGAGGHGRVVADIAVKVGYTNIAFVDDTATGECLHFPIIGKCTDLKNWNDGKTEFIIAIGNNAVRREIAEGNSLPWATLIHPSAQVGIDVQVGKGSVVMANAVLNANAKVGEHCIINTGAIVEHDNILADYVHISPGAVLGGTVRVGENTHIGLGAAVRNNIEIIENCIVGAGVMVGKDLTETAVYVGIPAKKWGGG